MTTHVRDAVEADLAPIEELNVAGWKVGYRGLLPDDFLDALTVETRAHLRQWHPSPATPVLVAEVDGALAGYAVLRPSPDPDGGSEVRSFYVHPDRYRTGVGRALMRAVVDRLPALGHDHATLWVLTSNERAIAFYRATGWFFDGVARVEHDPGLPPLPHRRMRHDLGPFVRDATPRDAERIAEIHVLGWRVAYRDFVDPAVLDGPELPERRLRDWTRLLADVGPRASVLVAEDGTGVVGFAFVGPSDDEDAGPGTAMLHSLYLDPAVWRGGVGSRLDDVLSARLAAAGFADATLWALAANERAAAFYTKRGWRRDGATRPSPGQGFLGTTDERWRRAV